jgi:hypothetical protein
MKIHELGRMNETMVLNYLKGISRNCPEEFEKYNGKPQQDN